MATKPVADPQIIDQFGPHRNYARGLSLETATEPERLVKTHCCF
jgi:assimilatory nitrate reductase catalytic subunit